jgi:transcription termination/antitermination protein NusA
LEKIIDTVEAIAHEKGISIEHAIAAFKEALINTAKKLTSPENIFEVTIDNQKKDYKIFRTITIVDDADERLAGNKEGFMALSTAAEFDSSIEVGDTFKSEFNLEDYGRTASANLFRELEYHIQREIEQSILERYKEKVGTIIIGTVTRIDAEDNTYVEVGELRGVLTQRNRIKGEKFKPGDTIKALLRYVSINPKFGLFLELSRTSPKFLEALMEREVPEIADGVLEITNCARIPGERAKISLRALTSNVDPVGAAVGVKGVRINAVSNELIGENIDCIEHSDVKEILVTRAMSPAVVRSVKISGEKAIVSITSDQKAKAIGKSGINIRLASMLTGMTIELNEIEGQSASKSSDSNEASKTKDTTALENLFK